MSFLGRIYRSKWFTTLVGVVVLCVLVWFFGPLLGFGDTHPLITQIARIIVILALLVAWLVLNLLRELRASKRDKKLAEGVADAAAAPDPDATASAEEVALLRDRLRDALHALRRAKLGGRSRRHLYELPWYMFIGPPGAGKTTALMNCGLNFPLADTHGPQAIQGVGGTRNCDWWFTDQAVLIDTAGRYTTQDSHEAVDSAAWLGFLKLLKQARRRQPLNGVLLAISLSDLSTMGEAERLGHARAMKKRVRELHEQFGVRVPVYVLFTKADTIAGFNEFFDNLAREDREQVWGMSFPVDDGREEGGAVAHFETEFDLLIGRLNDRMLERVQQEPDVQRRRLIYGFPQQIASLREAASQFLTEIFRPSRLEMRPLLRGIYLTSGTQDGTAIDRLLGAMTSQFGLQRQSVTAWSGTGRSYFLTRLMRDVVFGEAGLVSLDPKVERRTRWRYRGAYAACAAAVVLLAAFWTYSYLGNKAMIAQVHAEQATYDDQYQTLAKRGADDTDLPATLPALATLRTMRGGYEDREKSTPIALTFGLYQGAKLNSAAVDAYYRGLNGILLPRLLARLETQMQTHLTQPDFLYQALKVYLILGRAGPLDADLVRQWLGFDFNASFPGDDDAATRDALAAHVDALLERPVTALKLNDALVAQARAILTREPLAQYSYNRMMRTQRVQSLPLWTVADNAGPGAAQVFELRDGKSLNTGVPGIFTWIGYHQTFLPLLPLVTQDVAEDGWVLGRPVKGVAATIAQAQKLRRDVLGLYLDDYVRRWDAEIASIAVKPFGGLQQGLDELNLISAPDSPFRDLLQSIDQQTQLSRASATDNATAALQQRAGKVAGKAAGLGKMLGTAGLSFEQAQAAQILQEAFGTDAATGKPVDPATRVDEHFRWVHDFVSGDSKGASPMENAIKNISAVYQNLNQVANAPNPGQASIASVAAGGGSGGGGGAAAQQLQDLAKDLPKPVAAMLQTVSQSSSSVISNGASQQLSEAWRSDVLPLCNAALNRYPFVAGSSQDVPPDDFAQILGPGGKIDKFFNDNLKPFVDTTTTPWHWQAGGSTKLNLSPGVLTQFERAALIRDSLFSGGSQLQVKFSLTPVSLDPQIAKVTVEIAGRTLTYDHGPAESVSFQWPGADGKTLSRVTMVPTSGQEDERDRDGPWALLRLLDSAQITPSGQPDKFRLTFSGAGGVAVFELNASSVRNVFTLRALRDFRCPQTL